MTNKRTLIALICLLTALLLLISCTALSGTAQNGSSSSSVEDANQAKFIYYEAKLQSLTTQLESMEQQLVQLSQSYSDGMMQLENKLEQIAGDTPETAEPTDPPQGEPNKPATDANSSTTTPTPQTSDYTYRLENNFAILTGYHGTAKDVVVPAAVDGHLVIGLDDRVFADAAVRSVVLPATLERMGWFTFYRCASLEKVVIPVGVTRIGYASFDGCSPALCLYVEEGSYAEEFANSFGIKYCRV